MDVVALTLGVVRMTKASQKGGGETEGYVFFLFSLFPSLKVSPVSPKDKGTYLAKLKSRETTSGGSGMDLALIPLFVSDKGRLCSPIIPRMTCLRGTTGATNKQTNKQTNQPTDRPTDAEAQRGDNKQKKNLKVNITAAGLRRY